MIAEVLADGKLSERRKFKAQNRVGHGWRRWKGRKFASTDSGSPNADQGSYLRSSWCISAQLPSAAENEGFASDEGSPTAGDARSALRRLRLFFLLEPEDARVGLIGHLRQ